MKGVKCFNYTCQGESHKVTSKPCQDSSISETRSTYAMAIVSDGHGGARYFRSDVGSRIAIDCTKRAIDKFVKEPHIKDIFDKTSLLQFGIESEVTDPHDEIYSALSWLTSSIIAQWHKEIKEHATNTKLSEWELSHIEEQYLNEFRTKIDDEDASFEKTYGCTLMAYVQTESFWFAFQIGDGKAVFFDTLEKEIRVTQPIPWDDRCFLNKTTSICDSEASKEFRYCCCGDGTFPEAVFLGSDGIDDTYGDGDKLVEFYIRLYKEVVSTSQNKAEKVLKRDLPIISKIGSKDDMSIACVYNSNQEHKKQNYLLMSQWQIARIHERTNELEKKISMLREKIEAAPHSEFLTEAQRIEIQYAKNDLNRAQEENRKLDNDISVIIARDEQLRERYNLQKSE